MKEALSQPFWRRPVLAEDFSVLVYRPTKRIRYSRHTATRATPRLVN